MILKDKIPSFRNRFYRKGRSVERKTNTNTQIINLFATIFKNCLTASKKTLTFAVPKRTGLGKTEAAQGCTGIEKREKRTAESYFKILLARMKKDFHLCSPETDRLENKSEML